MSRSIAWRRNCPEEVKQRINEALEARFYILRETGPTGFLVKQDSRDTPLRVFLGDPNSCTCGNFVKDKELCIHILWVMLRKFRISKDNPLLFQKALVEREITELIRGIHVRVRDEKKGAEVSAADKEKGKLKAKSIEEDDVCPICQEEFVGCQEPLTHCSFGCGNNIHIKCMKIWAQHRKSDGESIIKCPLCRTDFGSYQDIIQEFHSLSSKRRRKVETSDLHIGATCHSCKVSPIQGNCYRCVVCIDFHLCQVCFKKNTHSQHSFQFRKNTNQRWRPASRTNDKTLPVGILNNLENREITNEDYDLLLQLDRPVDTAEAGNIHMESLSLEILRSNSLLIKNKENCLMCSQLFLISQCVRMLACNHTFHRNCIDQWILNGRSTCPLDGQRIQSKVTTKARNSSSGSRRDNKIEDAGQSDLAILGINSTLQIGSKPRTKISQIHRTTRRSVSSEVGGIETDFSNLAINGFHTRNSDVIHHPDSSLTRAVGVEDPFFRDVNHNESRGRGRGLPPIHPSRKQPRNPSGGSARRTSDSSTFSNLDMSIERSSLRVGSTPTERARSLLRNSPKPRSTKGTLLRNRLSSAGHHALSSSEPSLLSLSDAFQVSGFASRFSDSDSKS